MKKLFTLLAFSISLLTFAQVPQGISYQAIALNGSGNPVVSSNVGIRLSILDTSVSGTVLYTETHTKTTNAQGLFNLVIGQGTVVTGTFSSINWGTNSKFLKEELDINGGTNYSLVGTTQLLSVPYALYAGKVDYQDVVNGPDLNGSSSTWYSTSFITTTTAYIHSITASNNPTAYNWFSTPITGIPKFKKANSFLTTTNAYIFGPPDLNSGSLFSWQIFPISGTPNKILSFSFGNSFLFVTSTNAYAYFQNSSNVFTWTPTSISGTIIDSTISIVGFAGILTSTNAYVFNNTTGWSSISISGAPLKIKYSNSGILVLTSTNAYLYGPDNNGTGATIGWQNIPINDAIQID